MIRDQEISSSFPDYQSTYLRRISPAVSPTNNHKCCYNNHKDIYSNKEPQLFCCCYSSSPGPKSTSLLATLGVCSLVLAYTILGAFIFMALEGEFLNQDTAVAASKLSPHVETTTIEALRAETVSKLWVITEDLNILYKENWTKLAAEEVLIFQDSLFKVLRNSDRADNSQIMGTISSYSFHQNNVVHHKWSFSSSFLYSLTLITTIGYGSFGPKTLWGKLATIIYALIGIPLMLLYLSTTGDILARNFRLLYRKIWGRKSTFQKNQQQCSCATNTTIKVPVTLCLLIILAYICFGAVLFHRLEKWSLLEGCYFCFASLGTIGFGDLLPGENTEDLSLCACSAYILIGMALVAMCFSLIQERIITILRFIGSSCSRTHNNKSVTIEETLAVLPDS